MQKIITYCEKQHMFEEGDGVILGLSGGADSVCLFMILLECREKWNLKLLAVHVHHGIRGEQADRDAAFAKALCQRYCVEYVEERVDVPEVAGMLHMTEEEAGRYVRYRCFYRLLKEKAYQKIAVAHHKNDQAETLLFRMARGTGIDGLAGMRPVAGEIIRPLLIVSKVEIERILTERNESYCKDITNEDTGYTRNYIRHEVIPRLEQVNTEAVTHIAALAERMQVVQDYLQESVEREFLTCKADRNIAGITLVLSSLLKLHPYIQKAVIRRGIMELAAGLKDIQEVHIEAVLRLTESQSGRRQMLPYGITVWRGAGELYFQKDAEMLSEREKRCICVEELKTGMLYTFPISIEADEMLEIQVLAEKPEIIGKKRYTKYFDCGKIKGNLVLRSPEAEDYLVIDGMGHRKKLNRYFVDEKIPVYAREKQVVLAEGHHILWVLGYRISEAYKVTEKTGKVLKLSLITASEGAKNS